MRNSLYSVSIEEALTQIKGTNAYQRILLSLTFSIWLLCLLLTAYLNYELSYSSFKLLNGGMLLGSPSMILLSNYIGRKRISCISLLGTSFQLVLCLIFESHLNLCLVPLGVFLAGSLSTSYLLLIEIVQDELRAKYTAVIFSTIGFSISISGLVHLFISLEVFLGIVLLLMLFISLLVVLKAKESPRFLAAVGGKYSQARWTLNSIAVINNGSNFKDILEGEKVVGNQEIASDRTPTSTMEDRKHSFVQISDTVISVTTTKLSAVKRHSIFGVWKFKQSKKILPLLFFIGILTSFSKCTTESLLSSTGEKITSGITILVLLAPCYVLIAKTNRQFSLLIFLGISSICCVFGFVFQAKRCSEGMVCVFFDIGYMMLFSIVSAAIVGCLMVIYLITVESLHTTIRSLGMFYVEFALKLGLTFNSFFSRVSVFSGIIIAMTTFSVLCFVSICFLPEKCNNAMEDYLDEDREEMNKPLEISHMNVSCNQ